MRRCIAIPTILAALLLAAEARARDPKTEVMISFQTRMDTWSLDRKSWSELEGYWGYHPILEEEAHGSVFGPQVQLTRGRFYGRAFYLGGGSDLGVLGATKLSYVGGDVGVLGARGHLGVFLGIRSFSLDFSNNVYEIEDQSVTDVMLGFLLRADPEREGFFFDLGGAFGLRGLGSAFSDFENDMDSPVRADALFEGEVMLGYSPPGQPFGVRAGYGILGWQDKITESDCSSDECDEGAIGANHGFALEVMYVIGG